MEYLNWKNTVEYTCVTEKERSKFSVNITVQFDLIYRNLKMVSLGAPALYEKNTKGGTQFRSGAQSCPTPCDPMNHSTPGLPVHHQLPESTQTHVHRVSDAIQPSHPLSSPSPPAPNPSQHQGLVQQVSSSHEVAKVLEFQLQRQSFQ